MSGNFPPSPTGDGPGDAPRHPNWRLAQARLLAGRYEPVSPLRVGPRPPTMPTSRMDAPGAWCRWLFRSAALGRDDLALQAAAANGLVGAEQPYLAFQLLALRLGRDRNGWTSTSAEQRMAAADQLAGLATQYLAIRDAEPDLTVPQAVLDGAQSALWLLRHDRRHRVAAQRLLLSRTLAVRQQVASGARVLRYGDLPSPDALMRALDRSVTWLRVLSLGDVQALGLAPRMPQQPVPPGDEGEELA